MAKILNPRIFCSSSSKTLRTQPGSDYADCRRDAGQAVVILLIFITMAFVLTTLAATVTLINTQASGAYQNTELTLQIADSGVENAMLRILRNPTYAGETLTVDSGTTTITVTGTTTKTITSVGAVGNLRRTVTATATLSNDILTLTSWAETP